MRVLVIDDEPDVLLLCRVNFELAGHEVLEAPSGERGLELALHEHPDVIVLDVMLPGMSGIEVLEALQADPSLDAIPVVVITAWSHAEVDAELAGADRFVSKPFDPDALAAAVEELLA